MNCPECGYALTPFDKECLRCRNFAAKSIAPTNRPTDEDEARMRRIAQQVVQDQMKQDAGAGGAPAGKVVHSHPVAVFFVWGLTVAQWILLSSPDTLPIAYLLDIIALVIAVFLVIPPATGSDRANG